MTNLKNLPLSWIYSSAGNSIIDPVPLFRSDSIWLALLQLPEMDFIEEVVNKYSDKKILIRGCDDEISQQLIKHNFKRVGTGREAVLRFNTDHFKKKSLKELIRRGTRHGNVVEYPYSSEIEKKLYRFRYNTRHAKKPQLKSLFWDKFLIEMRLFVFEDHQKDWLGAVMVSRNSPSKFHSELLLRKRTAPVGVMEALIFNIFEMLKESDAEEFSLGEVPFITSTNRNIVNTKEFIINSVGKFFHFAYNYQGLYNFKNKFNPHWNDLYLCGKPNIGFTDLIRLSQKTNFLRLMFYKLLLKRKVFVKLNK